MNNNEQFCFEIKAQIQVLEEHSTGWTKELNLVAWNGNPAKFDIRDWNPDHTSMSKGITLTATQMQKILDSDVRAYL